MVPNITPDRLQHEVDSMRASCATLVLGADDRLRWIDIVTSNSGAEYDLVIEYPDQFPYEPPSAIIVAPKIRPGTGHQYVDGSLCLFGSPFEAGIGCTAGVVRGRAALWLLCYEHWLERGTWGAPEASHR